MRVSHFCFFPFSRFFSDITNFLTHDYLKVQELARGVLNESLPRHPHHVDSSLHSLVSVLTNPLSSREQALGASVALQIKPLLARVRMVHRRDEEEEANEEPKQEKEKEEDSSH